MCLEAKDNEVGESVSNGEYDDHEPTFSVVTSPSHQFPLSSINNENVNQLASKAKDYLEKKKKRSGGSNKKKRLGSSLGGD